MFEEKIINLEKDTVNKEFWMNLKKFIPAPLYSKIEAHLNSEIRKMAFNYVDLLTEYRNDEPARNKEKIKRLGIQIVQCKKCGQDIFFLETKNHIYNPVSMTLISHFADCPQAEEFRKANN